MTSEIIPRSDKNLVHQTPLDWIDESLPALELLLRNWGNVNSGTLNPLGVAEMARLVHEKLSAIADDAQVIPGIDWEQIDTKGKTVGHKLGPHVIAKKRPNAKIQVLLAIHMDTVYDLESPFQKVVRLEQNILQGPGVADAKGGLIVLLTALEAFERYVNATGHQNVGWEVIANSDEEIGSPSSTHLFDDAAKRVDLGLLFEPSLPHGGLISTRKGSGNFSIVARGISAHAGRDFHLGRNAIVATSQLACALSALNGKWPGLTLNISKIDGGGPANVVPDLGILRFNIRYTERSHEDEIHKAVEAAILKVQRETQVQFELHGDFTAPPKSMTPALERLLKDLHRCGHALGLELNWTESGGVCDGNRLAAAGIPNVDTLGVRGGNIHSSEEFILIDSLAERAKLTTLYLMKLANGELLPPAQHF